MLNKSIITIKQKYFEKLWKFIKNVEIGKKTKKFYLFIFIIYSQKQFQSQKYLNKL